MYERFDKLMDWLAKTYVHALNVIHYMHDKYSYERIEMALHDRDILRTMACGIAGLSVVADSLSAIKYATVRPVRDETGLIVDYEVQGEFPAFGNDDDRVDSIATELVERFMDKVREHPTYRGAMHTQSVLTITSNVVYGKATGNTPDGRRAGEPFAPGANPMNGRDRHGVVAAALSVAKLPYAAAEDGISLTNTIAAPGARPHAGGADHEPGRRARRLRGLRRLPYERERARPGHAAGCDGASGGLPAADHPGVRLRRQLHPADPRAATRRHQPDVPRRVVMRPRL